MAYTPTVNLPSPDFPGFLWGEEAAYHTPAREYVFPGRRVLQPPVGTWAYEPADCPGQAEVPTKWYLNDQVLVCWGCGLDSS